MARPTTKLSYTCLWTRTNTSKAQAYKARKAQLRRTKWVQVERDRVSRYKHELRAKVIEALGGPRCAKCGYDQDGRALQLDHVNGGGRKELDRIGIIAVLKRALKFGREQYQVLCANCNQIKKWEAGENLGRPRRLGE